ncbi:membrane bound O-acyl transferase family-domain-containing protein [Coprinopsis sp. MPI-PUGE-AT-0042]|nr:membrane bound O-acyl transferase family-domain-containing protein [Coprinopsis sp. MPI-PUGE-AT-0042]
MLTRHTVALGVLSEALAALSCTFRSSLHRSLTYGVFVLLNLYLVFHPQAPAPDVHVGYLVFTWFAVRILILADFHLLTSDMQTEFKRKPSGGRSSDKPSVVQAGVIAKAPFLHRLKWGFDLVWSIRGIGWEHVSSPPPTPAVGHVYPRGRFLIHRIGLLVSRLVCRTILFRAIQVAGPIPPFFSQLWWWRLLMVWACVFELRLRVQMIYDVSALLSVSLNLSNTDEWPEAMGRLDDMYTVRRFWGRTWHQGLRRMFMRHSDYFTALFNFPAGTFRNYFKLYIAFFISGLFHYAADYSLRQDWKGTSIESFVLQAVAISAEDIAIALGRCLGVKEGKGMRALGFFWVLIWFSMWIPNYFYPLLTAGMA